MNPELMFQVLQIGEAAAKLLVSRLQNAQNAAHTNSIIEAGVAGAESLVTHFQGLQSAARTDDQGALDAIRARLDAEADALALLPG